MIHGIAMLEIILLFTANNISYKAIGQLIKWVLIKLISFALTAAVTLIEVN